ncbi:hypothetical protein AVEN_208456-1 [Araneus ventricosus]|uniref:Uncharacterized protein n=1 Tax=Araneus ventricosus TaxID=182803 RepID=A0A4Y2PD91_ARAVE|nr:hypothetical protein AVEN_208456-1 [Araneus ventricosus]
MTRTKPDMAPVLQISAPHQQDDVWPLRMKVNLHQRFFLYSASLPPGGTMRTRMRSCQISKRILAPGHGYSNGGASFSPTVIVSTSFGKGRVVAGDGF